MNNNKLDYALDYIEDVIITNHLGHTKSVNLSNDKVLKKYFPENSTNRRVPLSREIIKPLLDANLIECTNPFHRRPTTNQKGVCRRYAINTLAISEIRDISHVYKMLNLGNYTNTNINTLNPLLNTPYNCNKTSYQVVLNKIDSIDPLSFAEIKFGTKDLTRDDVDNLAIAYKAKILKENKLFRAIIELLGNDTTCRLNMKVTYGEKFSSLKPSCRQCSDLARLRKDDWYRVNTTKGLNSFDLHGAIFSVTRLLQGGEFEPNMDIKKSVYIDSKYKDIDKQLLNRVYFCKSPKQAAAQYNFQFSKHGKYKDFPELQLPVEYFEQLYKEVDDFCLGKDEYRNNIFLYESLFELLVRKEVRDCGYQCYTVFDCFYYDCDNEFFLDILTTIGNHFNEIIYSLQ